MTDPILRKRADRVRRTTAARRSVVAAGAVGAVGAAVAIGASIPGPHGTGTSGSDDTAGNVAPPSTGSGTQTRAATRLARERADDVGGDDDEGARPPRPARRQHTTRTQQAPAPAPAQGGGLAGTGTAAPPQGHSSGS